jgi:hypothetical protein
MLEIVDAFCGLKKVIPEVAAFEYGTNNSTGGVRGWIYPLFLDYV